MIHVFYVVPSRENLAPSRENLAPSRDKKWPPNIAGRPPFLEKVVQVVQAPNSHARV
jgi:hypothetical protein